MRIRSVPLALILIGGLAESDASGAGEINQTPIYRNTFLKKPKTYRRYDISSCLAMVYAARSMTAPVKLSVLIENVETIQMLVPIFTQVARIKAATTSESLMVSIEAYMDTRRTVLKGMSLAALIASVTAS